MRISLLYTSLALTFLSTISAQSYDKQALAGWFLGLQPDKVVYAVNCGSKEELTDLIGIKYQPVRLNLEGVCVNNEYYRIKDSLEVLIMMMEPLNNGSCLTVKCITLKDLEWERTSNIIYLSPKMEFMP